jgi:hypothetical protein
MNGAGSKRKKSSRYVADFVTALPLERCRERLLHADGMTVRSGTRLTPIRQRVTVERDGSFVVERVFAGALRPICFHGCLDPHDSGGTWVHGAITDDAYNQVLIEGLIVFLAAFLITAALFLRLGVRAFVVTLPLLLMALSVASLRWRALQRAAEDVPRWLRQRLYLTAEQVRR